MRSHAWHALPLVDVHRGVESSAEGLSATEAEARVRRDGLNTITTRGGPSRLRKLAEQFIQPLVVVLIGAAALSIVLEDYVDAVVIGAVVVLNGIIGFVQEQRAEHAIAALGRTIVTEATVLRDGVLRRVPSERLVRGDVVALQSGDTVPWDLPLGDRKNLAFAGSAVTYGLGRGVVVATGNRTEAGRIAELMERTQQLETPLTRPIAHPSKLLV